VIFSASLSRSIRSVRRKIWSSVFYRQSRRIVADLTRPVRRIELGLVFRQDLTGPIKVFDADVNIDIAQASLDDVEQAAFLNPHGSRRSEIFRWRVQNGCVCFVARAGATLVAYNITRMNRGPQRSLCSQFDSVEAIHELRGEW
jgi:hypothetical protein